MMTCRSLYIIKLASIALAAAPSVVISDGLRAAAENREPRMTTTLSIYVRSSRFEFVDGTVVLTHFPRPNDVSPLTEMEMVRRSAAGAPSIIGRIRQGVITAEVSDPGQVLVKLMGATVRSVQASSMVRVGTASISGTVSASDIERGSVEFSADPLVECIIRVVGQDRPLLGVEIGVVSRGVTTELAVEENGVASLLLRPGSYIFYLVADPTTRQQVELIESTAPRMVEFRLGNDPTGRQEQ
jgi:hypothetical protein